MILNSSQLNQILNSQSAKNLKKIEIENVSINSRLLQNGSKTLFFAIVGQHHDAHLYINDLISKGVLFFVVETIPENALPNATFFVVKNTLMALQLFAGHYRAQFDFPIIGITGSNGKTIVKEWLNFLLSPDFNIIRSPKSYNSQVGVPLSVLGINQNHNLGIFEAGISTINEMSFLATILRPTIGVLTNIGSAHDAGFDSELQKTTQKLLLFEKSDVLICQKNETVQPFFKNKKTKLFSWSNTDETAVLYIKKQKTKGSETQIDYVYNVQNQTIKIPFVDKASIENAISCLSILLYLEYDQQTIHARMQELFPVEMRLKLKNGIQNSTLIDDSYSSDFESLQIALDFVESQKKQNYKTVILSDIFQSGWAEKELYQKVGQLIKANKIDRIIGIGTEISNHKNQFSNLFCYPSTTAFLAAIENFDFSNQTILVKGARNFQFEKIVSFLEEKNHETVLEINLNAITHNLHFFRAKLKPTTKIMVMVKAFGYGSGGFEIAKLLEYQKVDYLGVAFADEGIQLKNAGIKLPIMVLNPEISSFESIIQHGLEPEIYSIKGLTAFLKIAALKKLKNYPIHIKLDTGMHRLGFDQSNIENLISILEINPFVFVKSILSHLATSDNKTNKSYAFSQLSLFENQCTQLKKALKIDPILHILNTSGISNFSDYQLDMVRLGIGIYGVSNNPKEQLLLENVSTLKTVISQIRHLKKGDCVGYNNQFKSTKNMKIATIPIGYADGIARSWGNELGFVTINNQKATILGNICMDMMMIDISKIDCNEGDSVVVFGIYPNVNFIASQLKTIPYEILTNVSHRVKRVFYRE